MDNKEIVKQMIDFHKTTFKNCYSTMATIHDQAQKLFKTFVDKTPGISDENKKIIDQWNDIYEKGLDDFKKSIDEGYVKVEEFFDKNTIANLQDHAEEDVKFLFKPSELDT